MAKEVAADGVNLTMRVLAAGQVDACCVLVDVHHVVGQPGQLPGLHPLPAPDVQHMLASLRDSPQDQPAVVDVVDIFPLHV